MTLTLEDCCDQTATKAAQTNLPTEEAAAKVADLFKAMADPNRVRIIAALAEAELCVHDLALVVGMSQSAVSHQLRTLRSMDLVSNRREGRMIYYQLDDDHVRDLYQRAYIHSQHE